MGDRGRRLVGRAWRDGQGSLVVVVALMLVVLLGFAALASEVGFALFKQRQMQSTASAAALGSAAALITGHPANPADEAYAIAATDGFVKGVNGVTVTMNRPPHSGSYAGNNNAVEVIVSQPQNMPLSHMFYTGQWVISARAVALLGGGGSYCMLGLDRSGTTGIAVTNGAYVKLNECGAATNATGSSAVMVKGGATLSTASVSSGGGVSVTNGGQIVGPDGSSIVGTDKIMTSQAEITDPYADRTVPSGSGCKYGSAKRPLTLAWSPNVQTLNPDGVYCGGLTIGNGANVVMNPGVYIFNGGTFEIGGGINLVGNGVTIVLTGSGNNYTDVDIGNGASVNITAPTTGPTAGMAFFQDPAAPNSGTNNFQGGASMTVTGAMYFPSQTVVYSNGLNSSSQCTQLIAWHIDFKGGADFNSKCGTAGTTGIGTSTSQLVE